jgi:hypothetical protein
LPCCETTDLLALSEPSAPATISCSFRSCAAHISSVPGYACNGCRADCRREMAELAAAAEDAARTCLVRAASGTGASDRYLVS